MKYKKLLANLVARQKHWEARKGVGPGGHNHQKPGSEKK